MNRVAKLILVSLTLLGCSTLGGRKEVLRTRAAFDLDCPESELQLVELGGEDTIGVKGCGRRATYVAGPDCHAQKSASDCKWIMNTDAEPQQPK